LRSDSETPVALVTEVSNPILSATVLRLAGSGARVIACDVDAERLQAVSEDNAAGTTITTFAADLAVGTEVDRLMDFAIANFGRIDLLVNGPPLPPSVSWPSASEDQLMSVAAPALQRWIYCVKAVIPLLERSSGRIVSVVTSAGRYRTGYFRPQKAVLSSTPEALANGAILGLTRQLALELAPKRIRLNAVVVGLIEGSSEFEQMSARERQFVLEEISLGRLGTPEEVAAVIAFLASEASNYVTGDAIDVNGGWWMS
jgi:NAD(P)-dependent dehydrogenase (short-subunit alcohol dehydrogenase family)